MATVRAVSGNVARFEFVLAVCSKLSVCWSVALGFIFQECIVTLGRTPFVIPITVLISKWFIAFVLLCILSC